MLALEILGGLALLFVGGELLVRSAVRIAAWAGVSPLLIGLTIVGFGTSVPELVTSVQAALVGAPGIAVGNVVGSNSANILLILGLAAIVAPIVCSRACIRRDGGVMLAAALALLALTLGGALTAWHGAALVAALGLYLIWTWRTEQAAPTNAPAGTTAGERTVLAGLRTAAMFLASLGMVVLGARLLVFGSLSLAERFGLSETVVGLTIVAVGTSLPELATSMVAAWRRHPELALGNILGSNIFNVFGILGVTAIVRPIDVPAQILAQDIWVMLAATLALLVFAWTGQRLSRSEGAVLFGSYGLYLYVLMA